MKRTKFIWGLALIGVAVLLLLDAFGVTLGIPESIPLWRIILGALCAVWVLNELIHFRLPGIFFPLVLILMLFEGEIAQVLALPDGDIASPWVLLLIATLLTVGTAILIPKRKKHKKVYRDGDDRVCTGGRSTNYIDCSEFVNTHVENNMSTCDVFFTNTSGYTGGGSLHIENNMGKMVIHVPESWTVDASIENNMGKVDLPKATAVGGKTLFIRGENNMGSVRIKSVRDIVNE